MLPKKQRLTKRVFDHVFKTGKRKHSSTFQLIYISGGVFHGSVVVGKKVYKKAVDRNRLRRQLYAVLCQLQQTHSLSGTFILIAKPPLKEVSPALFSKEIEQLLKQIQ